MTTETKRRWHWANVRWDEFCRCTDGLCQEKDHIKDPITEANALEDCAEALGIMLNGRRDNRTWQESLERVVEYIEKGDAALARLRELRLRE